MIRTSNRRMYTSFLVCLEFEMDCVKGLALVERDLLKYVRDVKTVRGKAQSIPNHSEVLCIVKFVDAWVKRSEGIVHAFRKENLSYLP